MFPPDLCDQMGSISIIGMTPFSTPIRLIWPDERYINHQSHSFWFSHQIYITRWVVLSITCRHSLYLFYITLTTRILYFIHQLFSTFVGFALHATRSSHYITHGLSLYFFPVTHSTQILHPTTTPLADLTLSTGCLEHHPPLPLHDSPCSRTSTTFPSGMSTDKFHSPPSHIAQSHPANYFIRSSTRRAMMKGCRGSLLSLHARVLSQNRENDDTRA